MKIYRHIVYLYYVLKHKWYVFKACIAFGIPLLGVIHDFSKFLPNEWFPCVYHYINKNGTLKAVKDEMGFYKNKDDVYIRQAKLAHHHRNKHHWQSWVFLDNEGLEHLIDIPSRYRKEMVADWIGMGQAVGTPNILAWYSNNNVYIRLHPETRAWVEKTLADSTWIR